MLLTIFGIILGVLFLIACMIGVVLLWVIGEDVYNTGYRQGRQDGYREGVKDGSDRTKEGHTGL